MARSKEQRKTPPRAPKADKARAERACAAAGRAGGEERAALPGLLAWMQTAIEAGADPKTDPRVREEIKPNSRLRPEGRLRIYTRAYYARLRDVLKADYDAVAHILGDDAWRELADSYAHTHPSRHPNLNYYGAHLPDYILTADLDRKEILRDVARLELAIAQVFDRHDREALAKDALEKMTPDDWERVVLTPRPTVELHEFAWPVNPYLSDYYGGKEPELPRKPERSWVQVYRVNFKVWRMGLSEERYRLLKNLMGGMTLGKALNAAARSSKRNEPDFAADIQEWFKDWMSDGIFCAVEQR